MSIGHFGRFPKVLVFLAKLVLMLMLISNGYFNVIFAIDIQLITVRKIDLIIQGFSLFCFCNCRAGTDFWAHQKRVKGLWSGPKKGSSKLEKRAIFGWKWENSLSERCYTRPKSKCYKQVSYVCAHGIPGSAYLYSKITGKSKTVWGPTKNVVCGTKLVRSAEKFTK